ncbi:MAG: hypothetical protein ABSF55_01350, partial [Candidatus Staskawiczbacteria bacterium]
MLLTSRRPTKSLLGKAEKSKSVKIQWGCPYESSSRHRCEKEHGLKWRSKVRIKVSSEKEASALLADKDKLAGGIAPL